MDNRHFMFLLSLNQDNAAIGRAVLANFKSRIDPGASPLWIDSRGVGFFFTSALAQHELNAKLLPEVLTSEQRLQLNDWLLVQVGPRFAGPPEAKSTAWLNARFPTQR